MNAHGDSDRPCDEVTKGSRWFAWGHHLTVEAVQTGHLGVVEVRVKPDKSSGLQRPKAYWIPAWRIQRFGVRSGTPNA